MTDQHAESAPRSERYRDMTGGEGPRVQTIDHIVADFSEKHGYTVQDQGLVLAEETGELCEEILKLKDGKVTKDNSDPQVRKELGDLLFTAWSVAYLTGHDPVEALLERSVRNRERLKGEK